MSQTKKKAAKSAKPGAQKAPRPLSKATTAELTAILAARGLIVKKIDSDFVEAFNEIKPETQQINLVADKPFTIKELCDKLEEEANFPNEDLNRLGQLITGITGQEIVFEKGATVPPSSLKSHLEIVLDLFRKNNSFLLNAVQTLHQNLG